MLSIIIVNYKNAPLLRLCLKSLTEVLPESFNHEIIVVDVAAESETAHVAQEEFKQVVYLPFKENIGYTKGVNRGLAAAKGDAMFIINSDVVPLKESIEKMYVYLKEHPEIGLIGPQLLNFDGSPQSSCFRFYTPLTIICRRTFIGKLPPFKKVLNRFMLKDKNLSKPTQADWLMGSALMVSRKALEKSGPMDEKLYLYMSDVDWPQRFWENGYKVMFFPDVKMYHYHKRESHSALNVFDAIFNKRTRQHITDAIYYFRKNGIYPHNYT